MLFFLPDLSSELLYSPQDPVQMLLVRKYFPNYSKHVGASFSVYLDNQGCIDPVAIFHLYLPLPLNSSSLTVGYKSYLFEYP